MYYHGLLRGYGRLIHIETKFLTGDLLCKQKGGDSKVIHCLCEIEIEIILKQILPVYSDTTYLQN